MTRKTLAAIIVVTGLLSCGDRLASGRSAVTIPKQAGVRRLARIIVEPKSVFLSGGSLTQSLIVSGEYEDGTVADLTDRVRLSSDDPKVAVVGRNAIVQGTGKGATHVRADADGLRGSAFIVVRDIGERARPFTFAAEVAPVFSHIGCNASNCHGSLNGQSGFKLSLFGYDPDADYEAVVKASGGRRMNLTEPEKSLILVKPTFAVQHGGGYVLEKGSTEYLTLLEWIRRGAPQGAAGGPRLLRLDVYPAEQRVLTRKEQIQRLAVVGRYSDGSETDMTRKVKYISNDPTVAAVGAEGTVKPGRDGETTIMVRALGAVGVARIAVVLRPPLPHDSRIEGNNFIDELIFRKLARLRIVPSPLCSDSEFIRRATLDATGMLPESDRVKRFLADRSPDKRSRLVDELVLSPDYADFWSMKFGDLLTNTPQFLYNGTAYFQAWLREAMAANMPFDRFARELLTASGGTYEALPTNFYTVQKKPEEMATFTSQVFLGISLECARCHDHPSEKWRREDFMGLAAFFSQVKYKGGPRNNERYLYIDPELEFKHPDTKQPVRPKFLGGEWVTPEPGEDRRARLAEWLTSSSNPYFARAAVNRIWRELMGRGIVDPPDDFRATNPPTHPELLDRLAADFARQGYDLRHLIRLILNSRAYQLSASANDTNKDDRIGFSHRQLRRLSAEQLLDAIARVTEVPERFPYFHPGKRAVQLPDPIVDSYFLTIFDRPSRENATCTRRQSASLTQSLHLIGGETLSSKVRDPRSILARLVREGRTNDEILEHLYISALSRYPTTEERAALAEGIGRAQDRRSGLEDALWALMNSKEFLYNH